MWGQVHLLKFFRMLFRIIPTRVGTRMPKKVRDTFFKDHPHACGDKTIATTRRCGQRGSSPRVWGQVLTLPKGRGQYGIIPTRVGTSYKNCFIPVIFQGSSPRVWGQVARGEHQQVRYGIIPTRVGTRTGQYTEWCGYKDHPHACGDKIHFAGETLSAFGSSPRVWGQAVSL